MNEKSLQSVPMTGSIILAEAATNHPDGTTSMLRAGIDNVRAERTPALFRGALVARIEGEAGERGRHDFEINCIDEDGNDQLPPIKGQFDLPNSGGKNTLVLALQTKLERFGLYQFNLVLDKALVSSWNLRVEQAGGVANDDNNE